MTIATTTEQLNEIYSKHKQFFQDGHPSFHNLLWQIIVNEVMKEKQIAFTNVYVEHGQMIGIAHANEKGYQPTHVYFKKEVSYDEAGDICDELNLAVFGITQQAGFMIVSSSMNRGEDDENICSECSAHIGEGNPHYLTCSKSEK